MSTEAPQAARRSTAQSAAPPWSRESHRIHTCFVRCAVSTAPRSSTLRSIASTSFVVRWQGRNRIAPVNPRQSTIHTIRGFQLPPELPPDHTAPTITVCGSIYVPIEGGR